METCLRLRYKCTLTHHKGQFSRAACLSEHFLKSGGSTRTKLPGSFLKTLLDKTGKEEFASLGTFHSQRFRCVTRAVAPEA